MSKNKHNKRDGGKRNEWDDSYYGWAEDKPSDSKRMEKARRLQRSVKNKLTGRESLDV